MMHLFLTKGGTRLIEWGFITIDSNGIREGILIMLRLGFIMIVSTILTLTTSPLNLTDAFDRLFKPLKYIKIPVAALSMMMSIALRFIPTLMEELDKIILSQNHGALTLAQVHWLRELKHLFHYSFHCLFLRFNVQKNLRLRWK